MRQLSILLALGLLSAAMNFAADPPATGSGDTIDDFFNSPDQEKPKKAEVQNNFEDLNAKIEPMRFGGSLRFQADVNGVYLRDFKDWTSDYFQYGGDPGTGENSQVTLEAALFFSSKPSAALRYYGKMKVSYPFEKLAAVLKSGAVDPINQIPVPSIKVWELFADFNIRDTVYFRAGKQMIKWGVGYFFQPADIISLSAVDPSQPTLEREGPVAVKGNIPIKDTNLDLYVTVPGSLASVKDLAYAARYTFLAGNFEIGLGSRFQYLSAEKLGSDFQAIGTFSGSIWKFAVFGEAVYKHGSSKQILVEDSSAASGYSVWKPWRTNSFFNGSVGFRFSDTQNIYLSFYAQYLFNGEGYNSASVDMVKVGKAAIAYLNQNKLTLGDLANTGMHNAAANVTWDFDHDSKVHLSLFWIGNLSDGSGIVKPSLKFDITDEIKVTFYTQFIYGDAYTQYRGADAYYNVTGTYLLQPKLKPGFIIDLASGDF